MEENQVTVTAGGVASAMETTSLAIDKMLRQAIAVGDGVPGEREALMSLAAFLLGEAAFTVRELARQIVEAKTEAFKANADAIRADGGVKPVRTGTPSHRHNYDKLTNLCACGKEKSATAGGRPRKSAPVAVVDGVTKIDPPSAHLPLGDAAADRFAGGGLGSSGVRR